MKKKGFWRFAAIAVGMTLLFAGCAKESVETAAPSAKEEENQDTEQIEEETKEEEPEAEADTEEAETTERLAAVTADGIDYLSVEGLQAEPGTVIAMIGKDSKSNYWKAVKKGAQDAVTDLNTALGYKGADKIKLTFDAPVEEDVEEQINIIDELLDKNPDVLCIGFVDVFSGSTQLELAGASGIPVLAIDSDVENDLITATCKTDNYRAGREAASAFAKAIGGEGKIALLVHSELTSTGLERESGFLDELKIFYPDIQVVDVSYMYQDEREVSQIVADVLAANPDLKGYFATNDAVMNKLIDAVNDIPEQTLLLGGFDSGSKHLEAIRSGLSVGSMSQDPYGMGYASVVASIREILGMGNPERIETGHYWVTAENIDDALIQNVLYE